MQIDRETIIKLAREAGLYTKCDVFSAVPFDQLLEKFAKLVAEHEREACAKVCDAMADRFFQLSPLEGNKPYASQKCAAAIRERGK